MGNLLIFDDFAAIIPCSAKNSLQHFFKEDKMDEEILGVKHQTQEILKRLYSCVKDNQRIRAVRPMVDEYLQFPQTAKRAHLTHPKVGGSLKRLPIPIPKYSQRQGLDFDHIDIFNITNDDLRDLSIYRMNNPDFNHYDDSVISHGEKDSLENPTNFGNDEESDFSEISAPSIQSSLHTQDEYADYSLDRYLEIVPAPFPGPFGENKSTRISVPLNYKPYTQSYRAHRRKSYDPGDSVDFSEYLNRAYRP